MRKDRSSYIRANATIELQSVNPFFDRYVGNHDIWENDFKAIKTIKADGRYTKRALTVLPRLGFQIIVSAPESKTAEILSIADKAYVAYKDPATGNSYLQELDREPATQAETQDATVEQTQPATEA